MQLITGNTYPVRDQIKALGGRWEPKASGWMVIDLVADECRRLVAEAPVRRRGTPTSIAKHRGSRCLPFGTLHSK